MKNTINLLPIQRPYGIGWLILCLFLWSLTTFAQTPNTGYLYFDQSGGQKINLWQTNYGIGVQNLTQYFRSDVNFAWYRGGTHHQSEFNPGGGTLDMVLKQGDLALGRSTPWTRFHAHDADPSSKNGIVGTFTRQGQGDLGISFTQEAYSSYGILHPSIGGIEFRNNLYRDSPGQRHMRITATGDVAIGDITTPVSQFQVHDANPANGIVTALTRDGQGDVGISFQQLGVGSFALLQNYDGDLHFVKDRTTTTAGEIKMMLSHQGRLGIGTLSPGAHLDVNGHMIGRDGLTLTSGEMYFGEGYGQLINLNNDDYGIGFQDSQTTYFRSNNFAWYRDGYHSDTSLDAGGGAVDMVLKSGNLGVGTSAPIVPLHVKGSFHVEASDGLGQVFHVSAGQKKVFVGDSAYIQYSRSLQDTSFTLNANDTFSMWVSEGIVSRDFALADPHEWADFVFDEAYELASLEDVESYINQKGHLPNVPSAQEVKANGYTVHEMNVIMMQKIEELTLYTIEQQKAIQALEVELLKMRSGEK